VTEICVFAERQVFREKVGEVLSEKMLYIVEAMSRHEYMPKIPNQSELENVFDVSLPDIQPYLHRV
jgi:autophagy-related protein 101